MNNMFSGCSSLKSLLINNFDTSKVTTMEKMFYGCSSLTSLNISNFKTEKVVNMNMLFAKSEVLSFIDIRHFNMINVISFEKMFESISEKGTIIYDEKNIPEDVIKQIPEEWDKIFEN